MGDLGEFRRDAPFVLGCRYADETEIATVLPQQHGLVQMDRPAVVGVDRLRIQLNPIEAADIDGARLRRA